MAHEKVSSRPVEDEPELVHRAQAGDQEAFALLYDAYLLRIYRYVFFRVADEQAAEDIASDVFLKAWEKLDTYRVGTSPFIAWLYRIAHNTVIDHYRTRKLSIKLEDARPVEVSHDDRADEKLDLQFELQELQEALQELTEEQKQVLILKFAQGLSTPEIASQLGKQQGAVRALQMRALQGLARLIDLEGEKVYER
jgi:RNA polymerase sigma-70 factor (ECF subfamily)